MNYLFFAKSSSGEPYPIEVAIGPETVRVFCHCPAGVLRQVCKHKVALIKGEETVLADPKQASALVEMRAVPEFVALAARLNLFERQLATIEQEKAALAKREKAVKAQFGRELAG